ncbi:MAG: efflux RND transporter periplasmic adaptor subunit [Verrucomicrobiota bacterium]
MSQDPLERLRIASHDKRRRGGPLGWIVGAVVVVVAVVAWLAVPRPGDNQRTHTSSKDLQMKSGTNAAAGPATASSSAPATASASAGRVEGSALTAQGYIVARERIELSPRFMGVVKWIGVRKGDSVTNGQVVVRLDDSEYRARMAENDGQVAVARVAVDKARMDVRRATDLVRGQVEMQKVLDDAGLALASAEATLRQVEGARRLLETWLEWCTIRSPVNGVVLERMVDADELVTPQSFGSGRGPSTSLLAVADLGDLQVEVDLGESDLAKVRLGQRCVVTPQAYRDRRYEATVAEIAPEASRQKGTLQVKVKVKLPDRYLTPELSADVDFIGDGVAR